ncbi:hypothetical protein [Pandoraea pulmonicola]|uniref:hypothetical protein n=1 Tax=Pandoraea pulmonicola TaxID=93221 RepID=UPI0011C046F3|nr:hypothetical protein [Pandoraea pulmonicola]
MKYVRTTLLSACLLSSLAGCVVSVAPGEGVQKIADATQESLQKQFVTGVATRDDVAAQLGAPSTKTVAGNYEIWNYQYVKRAAVGIVLSESRSGRRRT